MDSLDFEVSKEFEHIDTKKVIEDIDEAINKNSTNNEELKKLRSLNHDRYFKLDIESIKNLPFKYEEEANNIIDLYNAIDSMDLLNDDNISAKEHKNIINIIDRRIDSLKSKLEKDLLLILKVNNEMEEKLNLSVLEDNDPTKELERKIIEEKLNSLKFFNLSINNKNPGFEIFRQEKRVEYIKEIEKLIFMYNGELTENYKKEELKSFNKRIAREYSKYLSKIDDLKKYIKVNKNFEKLLDDINKIFDYDKTNYEAAKSILNNIIVNKVIDNELNKYDDIINRVKNPTRKMDLIPDELKKSILENYSILLTDKEKDFVSTNKYLIKSNQILNRIWEKEITNPIEYKDGMEFKFLCYSFKLQKDSIIVKLITSNELKLVNDYDNYELGYIYAFKDNILNIDYNESKLFDKTPIQVENIFNNEKKSPEIKLSNNSIKQAIYYIKNNEFDEDYELAKKLSIDENLPLIVLDLQKYKADN